MRFLFRVARTSGVFALLSWLVGMTPAVHAETAQAPSWGAIASKPGAYGYSFNHSSREEAERAARAQCDSAGRRSPGVCVTRAYFDRGCGALATGNFGEWGAAIASTSSAAGKVAIGQCDAHLPTEPCKVVVSVCSQR